jgi:uncharacterized membrane protein
MNATNTKDESSKTIKKRGMRQLNRLTTLIDVIYGFILFRLFYFLPRPEVDGFGANDLVRVLKESYLNYLVILVGLFMIIIYWGQSNLQINNLKHTDTRHAVLSILQVFSLLVYFYFVRLDVEFDGLVIALQMESIFLAIAGFMSIWAWQYARKKDLISDEMKEQEKEGVLLKLMPEPIVSVLTLPFAILGPDIWTASWLLLIPVTWLSKKIRTRMRHTQ